jgi:hypothetical protein
VRAEGDEVAGLVGVAEDLWAFVKSVSGMVCWMDGGLRGERVEKDLPTALPTDQAMKFIETAKDFLVWPATFLVGGVSWNV